MRWFWALILTGSSLHLAAQTDSTASDSLVVNPVYVVKEKPVRPQLKLKLAGVEVTGDRYKINYDSPYTGMIELSLLDPSGKRVFYNQYVCSIGLNWINLKAGAFQKFGAGVYTYVLRFKDEDYTDTLTIAF